MIDYIALANNSSLYYAFTSLFVYNGLNMAFFNQGSFDSPQAIATGTLFYQDFPNTTQDNSQYTNVAGMDPLNNEASIGFVPQPIQSGTYSLLVGNAAVLDPDGSIGPPTYFAYADTQ